MGLSKAFLALASRLQEAAAAALSHDDIHQAISSHLKDAMPDDYPHVLSTSGDDQAGEVVYAAGDGTFKAPYEMQTVNGKRATNVDQTKKVKVVPRTVYDEEQPPPDDQDNYAGMKEADRRYAMALDIPTRRMLFFERFVSQDERDNADSSDFAGKNQSYPILKKEDVSAAASSIGRAGPDNYSIATLKSNIIRITKRKGWESELPQSWQDGGSDDDSKEAKRRRGKEAKAIEVAGEVIPLKEGAVGQNGTVFLKLIQPGWGSSGYYSPELLERDGPTTWPSGTKMFWNHQTDAEERQRPEGDLRDLASVLTEDPKYLEKGPAGPGLYAHAQVTEQFRQPIEDLSKHIGVSIRASGNACEGVAEGKKGLIIEKLSNGRSVDYITTPGAGGKILQLFEAARVAKPSQGDDMAVNEAEFLALKETSAGLQRRLLRADAREAAQTQLASIRLPDTAKTRIVERAMSATLPVKDGELDREPWRKLVEAELKTEATYLESVTGGRVTVIGMGAAAPPTPTAEELKEAKEQEEKQATRLASNLGIRTKEGLRILMEGREAFDPRFQRSGSTALAEEYSNVDR